MSKHAARQFLLARLVLGSAATVLAVLVGWIAVRVGGGPDGVGDPILVQPTASLQAVDGPLPTPSASLESTSLTPSPAAPVSSSPSPTLSPSRTAPASPSATTKPTPSKSASRTPSASPSRNSPSPTVGSLDVTYTTSGTWREGFIASVRVVNNGSTARDWTVALTYPSSADVEVRGGWNAAVSASGDTVTLNGRSLAPGASITAGFQGAKDTRDAVNPVTCSVGGGSCRMG